jgi:hypothetical protein
MHFARLAVPGTWLGISLALVALPAAAAADDVPVVALHAFAMNFTGVGSGDSGQLDLIIERWSTDQEREQLQGVLAEKGGTGLLQALLQIKPRVGYIRSFRLPAWEVQFAQSSPLPDGGRRIVLATDRPLTEAERARHNRTDEYEFLLVEIRLDKQGKGEGRTAEGTKVRFNKDTRSLEIDQYSAEPVKLINVEVFTPKPNP